MTLPVSLPPEYVTTPAWVIASAFSFDPPKRALLGSYNRLLSLAWNSKERTTPTLREEFFYDGTERDGSLREGFLRVSRRQFYQVINETEGMRWLRLARPRAGFVQFVFHGSDPLTVAQGDASAKNRIEVQKTALVLNEEEESLVLKDSESSSSSSEEPVRKIALTENEAEMHRLVDNMHLVFDPETYGVLEWRPKFAAGIPERVLGWIAKAYHDRENLTRGGGPIGLVVAHILEQDAPHPYYLTNAIKILPEAFLEAIGAIEFECSYCPESFGTRELRQLHEAEKHPYPCTDCSEWFMTEEERKTHWMATHDVFQPDESDSFWRTKPNGSRVYEGSPQIAMPTLDGSIESTWQAVLCQLQEELPRAFFDTWLRDTVPVRYDSNRLIVSTRNSYARDWLTNRLTEKINMILRMLSETPITVSFVVAEQANT